MGWFNNLWLYMNGTYIHTGFLGWHSSSSRPYRKDGVVELTFEIPAAEGSEPPLLRRESSSSPASGESVVFSPEKKVPKQRRNPNCGRRESSVVTLWLVGCFFVKKKHRSNRRCAFGCAKNPPWCWSLGETTRNRWSEIWDWEVFFCFNFPSNGSHGDWSGIWDESLPTWIHG